MRTVTIFLCFFLLSISAFAATNETEPNNSIGDEGIITINAIGDYTGNLSGLFDGADFVDIWYLSDGSSAVDFNFTNIYVAVDISLHRYSDSDRSSYEGDSGGWVEGQNPGLLTLDNTKYYALEIVLFDDYSITREYTITVEGESSLPVELSSFSVSQEEHSVILEWTTESETDNLGFLLERHEENEVWTQIASYQTHSALKGQGNTSSRTKYMFTDSDVNFGKEYFYRLSDVSTKGEITIYASLSIRTNELPKTTEMENAYPNPFNPQTYISYCLVEDSEVNIAVFDVLGRYVKTLHNGQQHTGSYHVYWDGTNDSGTKMSSGSYFIRMQTENTNQVQKVLLSK